MRLHNKFGSNVTLKLWQKKAKPCLVWSKILHWLLVGMKNASLSMPAVKDSSSFCWFSLAFRPSTLWNSLGTVVELFYVFLKKWLNSYWIPLVSADFSLNSLRNRVGTLWSSLCPESSENIPILLQGVDLYFSNQNDLRNPKMGSKQSVTGAT